MASGDYYGGGWIIGRIIRIVVNFWRMFFDFFRFYDPPARERLHLEGVTIRPDTIAEIPRAMPFRAFIARALAHREFLSGGFNTDATRAGIA